MPKFSTISKFFFIEKKNDLTSVSFEAKIIYNEMLKYFRINIDIYILEIYKYRHIYILKIYKYRQIYTPKIEHRHVIFI